MNSMNNSGSNRTHCSGELVIDDIRDADKITTRLISAFCQNNEFWLRRYGNAILFSGISDQPMDVLMKWIARDYRCTGQVLIRREEGREDNREYGREDNREEGRKNNRGYGREENREYSREENREEDREDNRGYGCEDSPGDSREESGTGTNYFIYRNGEISKMLFPLKEGLRAAV